ncbi:hypothetical protein [Streptomyces indicus]|uniref:Uncharacterized protein n=1 Tax=Streptomyces indicus TaxID=417292 RepID=A0A1G9IUJ9_9ACTN|nr:hypothetical protein [Streptomyces indicus]SDL28840.1 hypothetical protein SAMN05421806_12577 [Streptomyces indicus]
MDDLLTALDALVWVYILSAAVLTAAAGALIVAAGYWTGHLIGRAAYRIRHSFDKAQMACQPEPPRPTSSQAIDDYWTIRRAWHLPAREEARR